ncbi:hypothetical protein VTO42DRAFT_6035 [Malbranchea cinnamomea]
MSDCPKGDSILQTSKPGFLGRSSPSVSCLTSHISLSQTRPTRLLPTSQVDVMAKEIQEKKKCRKVLWMSPHHCHNATAAPLAVSQRSKNPDVSSISASDRLKSLPSDGPPISFAYERSTSPFERVDCDFVSRHGFWSAESRTLMMPEFYYILPTLQTMSGLLFAVVLWRHQSD